MKTSELTDQALDWAVATIENRRKFGIGLIVVVKDGDWLDRHKHNYSTDWAQAGPIIEAERILFHGSPGAYHAWIPDNPSPSGDGETHLIAAMRSFVASKLGPEVDVPAELVQDEPEDPIRPRPVDRES